IRVNVRLAEAPSHGLSVHDYAPDSNGAKDYLNLAKEVFERMTGQQAPEPVVKVEPEVAVEIEPPPAGRTWGPTWSIAPEPEVVTEAAAVVEAPVLEAAPSAPSEPVDPLADIMTPDPAPAVADPAPAVTESVAVETAPVAEAAAPV